MRCWHQCLVLGPISNMGALVKHAAAILRGVNAIVDFGAQSPQFQHAAANKPESRAAHHQSCRGLPLNGAPLTPPGKSPSWRGVVDVRLHGAGCSGAESAALQR